MTIFDQIEKYADNPALITEQGEVISYSDLIKLSEQFADHVNQRSLIFVICTNTVTCISAYVGFMRNRNVLALLPDTINEDNLLYLMNQYKPAFIFFPKNKFNIFQDYKIIYSNYEFNLLKTNFLNYPIYSELALLMSTSGSTGSPKLVRQSYLNIKSNIEAIILYLSITDNDRAVTTMPMSYAYGLSIINTHLYSGCNVVLNNYSLVEKKFWELFKNQKVTTISGVPYTFEILKKLQFEKMELPFLRYITQAGGKLRDDLVLEWINLCEKMNKKFFVMYGQTEASPRMSYLPWGFAQKKYNSIGYAIPGGKFILEDEHGNEIALANTAGELVYIGKNVALGYANDYIDLEKGDENKGILHTGDIAKRDEEGFYYIVGRKKRFIKLYGNRISLDELEMILEKNGYRSACVGFDNNLIVYTENGDQNSVKKFLVELLKINLNSVHFRRIESIPRSSAGKILYSQIESEEVLL